MNKRKKTKAEKPEKITRAILKDGHVMKIHPDGRLTRMRGRTNWKALAAKTDADIDYTDSPEIDEASWATAKLLFPRPKNRVTIRLDQDILSWLKDQGTGYQTRINAILRQYMASHTGR